MLAKSPLDRARERLREKLLGEARFDLAGRLSKCGQKMTLRCLGCHQAHVCRTRCDLKWCPSCQPLLAQRTAARYAAIAQDCQWPLMITWTVQHSRQDSCQLMREVRRAHTALRRQRWFRKHVKGGVIAYELTTGAHGWHPHAHSLLDCKWLAVTESHPRLGASKQEWKRKALNACAEVAEQWSLALRRKGTVEVHRVWRRSNGIADSVSEVLKYSAKGSDLADSSEPVGPVIDMLSLTRNVCSWGSFYRHKATRKLERPPLMCSCGCSDWLPEEVILSSATDEHGLTRRDTKRKRR